MKFTRVQLESKVEQQFTIFRLFTKSAQPVFPLYPPPSKSLTQSVILDHLLAKGTDFGLFI